MNRRRLLPGVLLLAFPSFLSAQQPADLDRLKEQPIAVGGGKVGELLRQWWKEGTAAGNAGDFYDNRDGDHSLLNLKPYPQLSLFKYSEQDFKLKKNWAAAREVRPHVTFGNSSTSAPAHLGGSNPRSYYVSQLGHSLLHQHYSKNNLYIYPEHRDHDPGHNGKGPDGEGYGDLYPTNTPYLIISQGSSGSDQPFMRMMPSVLAAFRPEVKAKLVETGLLMPTVQMLFRSTNKHLKDSKEYLTGKAHPTVFEGAWVDELALVQKAHALDLKALPPLVQLRVLDEDKAVNGIDFFDRTPSEVLAYTPAVIARVHRGKAQRQRIVVDAGASYDLNKQPLTFTWVLLRGDPGKVAIVPKKDDSSVVEITVAHHERRPIATGSAMESNRVDIGVFVHNGTHYSTPGFVTFFTLDREARTYSEQGKPLEIAHGQGTIDLRVKDWTKLLDALANGDPTARWFSLDKAQQAWFRERADLQRSLSLQVQKAQEELKRTEKELKDSKDDASKAVAKKNADQARDIAAKAQKALDASLDQKEKALDASLRQWVDARLRTLTRDPLFTQTHRDWLASVRMPATEARFKALWQKPIRLGIANAGEVLTPLLPGKTLADAKWTTFERAQLEFLHASLLSGFALPGVLQVSYQANYVDHRLSAPREWRDVYRYDARGEPVGWLRYGGPTLQEFNHEGLLVVDKDALGRCVRGREVRYVQDAPKEKWINTNPLRMEPGDRIAVYEFDGAEDPRGRRVRTEAAK